jgi:hypothetical protein
MRQGNRALPAKPIEGIASKVVIAACAASAGAHGGLVPEHMREEPKLGLAFIVAVVLLLGAVAALTIRAGDRRVAQAAALLLTGLMLSWAASRITGIPLLQPQPESVDAVGVVTNLVEALGLALALWLSQPMGGRWRPTIQEASR